jgi:hypothetical protein
MKSSNNCEGLNMQSNPNQFIPLHQETRLLISTELAAYHLNRRPQTLRVWACEETGPLRPVRINGRLAWPVAAIRTLLNGGA